MKLVKNQNIQIIRIVLINTCNKGFTATLYKIIETTEDMPGSRSSPPPLDIKEKPQTLIGKQINTLDKPLPEKFSGSAHGQMSGTYSIRGKGGGRDRGRMFHLND